MGYLASRIPVQALLHLRHPEAEDPSAEHPWCAWDICEGGFRAWLLPLPFPLFSEVLPLAQQLTTPLDFCHRTSKLSGLECSGANWKDCIKAVGLMASSPLFFSPSSLGRETWLQDSQGCAERCVQSGQQPPAAGAGWPPYPVLSSPGLQRTERSASQYASPAPAVV